MELNNSITHPRMNGYVMRNSDYDCYARQVLLVLFFRPCNKDPESWKHEAKTKSWKG